MVAVISPYNLQQYIDTTEDLGECLHQTRSRQVEMGNRIDQIVGTVMEREPGQGGLAKREFLARF